jgi:hypothetical protein
MAKKYFIAIGDPNEEEGFCYELPYWYQYMQDNGILKLDVCEARVERGAGYFFCLEVCECGEIGNCGKLNCDFYKPRNGKSGICKNYGYCYEPTDKKITLYVKDEQRKRLRQLQRKMIECEKELEAIGTGVKNTLRDHQVDQKIFHIGKDQGSIICQIGILIENHFES